jgi:hypothetical protein
VNLTVITEPASDETGEAIAGNLSLVRDEIAVTTAKIDEQQVAVLARHLAGPRHGGNGRHEPAVLSFPATVSLRGHIGACRPGIDSTAA